MMQVVLALRGINKKKQLEAWEQGSLNIKPADLSLQGTTQRWDKAIDRASTHHGEAPQVAATPGGCS